MLTLSDNPDVEPREPERSLLLGYPLPSGEHYVLSRTWAATEVERPGCVWTHSLLLGVEGLAVHDALSYLSLFTRPRASGKWAAYERRLELPRLVTQAEAPDIPAVVQTVIWTLYQAPLRPVDVRREGLDGHDPQHFLLSLWGQQWPALRGRFSFAEAPRVARRSGRSLFDLQVTDRPGKGSWDSGDAPPPRTVLNPVADPPAWCGSLARDLARPGDLRDFLWAFGPTSTEDRSAVSSLSMLWSALEEGRGAPAVLSALARGFPDPSVAVELKRAILAASVPGPDETDVLLALAGHELPESFANVGLDLKDRAARLAKVDPAAARHLLEALPRKATASTDQLVEGLARAMTKTQIGAWARDDPGALADLLAREERLAEKAAVWSSAPPETFWPSVRNPRAAKQRRRSMLRGMLVAHSESYVSSALEGWPDGPSLYLDLLEEGRARWHQEEILAGLPKAAVLSWLANTEAAPGVLAGLLTVWDPRQLSRVPRRHWETVLEEPSDLDDETLIHLFLAAVDPESGLGPEAAVTVYGALVSRNGIGKAPACSDLTAALPEGRVRSPREAAALLLNRAFLDAGWNPLILLEIGQAKALERILAADGQGRMVRRLVGKLGARQLPAGQAEVIYSVAMETDDHKTLHKIIEAVRGFVPWL
jgi:hypothetical protein